jgi:hypothetical protein
MPLVLRAGTNNALPPILSQISTSNLGGLEQGLNQKIHPQSMFWYPIDFVVYLFALWAVALCLHDYIIPSRFFLGCKWKACGNNRRTMIVYLLSIVSPRGRIDLGCRLISSLADRNIDRFCVTSSI